MSILYILRCLLLPIIMIPQLTVFAGTTPKDFLDVMGVHRMSNEEQCRRLCWYRKLCNSYSYIPVRSGDNCVLHADYPHTPEPSLPSGWKNRKVHGGGILHSCRDRPCRDMKVCVPTDGPHNKSHMCYPFPADCRDSNIQGNMTFQPLNGTTQGQTATVECLESVKITQNRSTLSQCLVTSRWNASNVDCVENKTAHNQQLLSRVDSGWQACIRGVFSDDDVSGFSFRTMNSSITTMNVGISVPSNDIMLRIAFRHKEKIALWNTLHIVWGEQRNASNVTIFPKQRFSLELNITSEWLNMKLIQDVVHQEFHFPFDGRVNISDFRYFETDTNIAISSINFGGGCENGSNVTN